MIKAQKSAVPMSYCRKRNAKFQKNKTDPNGSNFIRNSTNGKSIMVFIPASSPLRSGKTQVKSTVDSSVTATFKYRNDSQNILPVTSYRKFPVNTSIDLSFNKALTDLAVKSTPNSSIDLTVKQPIKDEPLVKSLINCEIPTKRSLLPEESSEIQAHKMKPNEELVIADTSIKKKRKPKSHSHNYYEDINEPKIKKTKLENSQSLKRKTNSFHIKLMNKEISLKPMKIMTQKFEEEMTSNDEISLIPNGTKIKAEQFKTIKWNSASTATRKLLTMIFSNEILATHSLTGKPSPAFVGRERPLKQQLNPDIIQDIITTVVSHTNGTTREIRATITTKCADIARLLKSRKLNIIKRNK